MKLKILNLALVLTSFIGYLEWGGGNKMFLIEGEIDILSKLFTDPLSVIHPFTLIPLIGQLILLFTLFQKHPGKWPTFIGLGAISLLLLFMFFIGLISQHYATAFSTIPFLATGVLVIRHHRKRRAVGKG